MHREQYHSEVNDRYYQNPIVMGDFSDPSILKDGDDYYLVHSVCGDHQRLMPLWHSTDLINWQLLYHVFDGCFHSGLQKPMTIAWAPDLVKVGDTYYIYNYTPDYETWVTTCTDIKKGDWTELVPIDGVTGIDPGHVMDDDGNRYLCMSTNVLYPLAADGLSVTGAGVKIAENWPIPDDIDIEGMCTESPKFFKHGGYYYFLTAQGGTMGPATSHCVVAYRAKHPKGPYEMSPYNPIVHTKDKAQKWWSTGHGSLVDGPDGNTYIFYHGILNAHRYMGRQSIMMPVTWTADGWFYVDGDDGEPQQKPSVKKPTFEPQKLSVCPADGSFGYLYNFDDASVTARYSFTDDCIVYDAQGKTAIDGSAITFMPQGYHYEYAVTLDMKNTTSNFAIGYRFAPHINCGIAMEDGQLLLFKHGQYDSIQKETVLVTASILTLKMVCNHGSVSYWYQMGDATFKKIPNAYDISDWNPNVVRGFSYVNPCLWSFGTGSAMIKKITYQNLD